MAHHGGRGEAPIGALNHVGNAVACVASVHNRRAGGGIHQGESALRFHNARGVAVAAVRLTAGIRLAGIECRYCQVGRFGLPRLILCRLRRGAFNVDRLVRSPMFCHVRYIADGVHICGTRHEGQPNNQQATKQFFHCRDCTSARASEKTHIPQSFPGFMARCLVNCVAHALRALPPFSAQVRVQRICMTRSIISMMRASAANTKKPHM
jgi:hypothetical protein